jgi:polar amino acid transport system substrate-binding protein
MMKHLLKGIIALLFIGLCVVAAQAEDGPVILGANESPPYWSKRLPGNGLCGEILYALSAAAGMQSKIEFKPLQRLIEDDSNNDLGNPAFYLPQQEFQAIIPIVVYRAAFYFYRPHYKEMPSIQGMEDLVGMKIGVLQGTLLDRSYFERKGVKFEQSYSQASLFKKLRLGRLDLVIAIDRVGEHVIQQLFPDEAAAFVAIPLEHSVSPIAIMLAEQQANGASIAARYRQGLARIIEDGTYLGILERYYGPGKAPTDWRQQLQRFSRLYDLGGGN